MTLTRDNLLKVVQSVVALVAFVAAVEIALRLAGIAYPPKMFTDPVVGLIYRPGTNFVYREEGYADVQVNQESVRDVDWPLDKPADEFRIAVLGDSFVEALQVPVEDRLTEQMADLLSHDAAFAGKKVRVMNFGMSGFGTGQEYLMLRERAAKYQPDIVVLAFLSGNDFSDNCRSLREHNQRPFFEVRDGKLVLDDSFAKKRSWKDELARELAAESRILQVTYEAKRDLRDLRGWAPETAQKDGASRELELNEYAYLPPETPAWKEAWQITEQLLLAINDESRKIGAKLLVVVMPNDDQMHPDPARRQQFADHLKIDSLEYPNQRIMSFCREHEIPALDLLPPMRTYGEEHGVYLHGFENTAMGRGHWNPAGHRLGAELIAAKIHEMRTASGQSPSDAASGH